MWYSVPTVNSIYWYADVVDLFSSTLESIQTVPALNLFLGLLLFFVIIRFFFWLAGQRCK